VIPPEIVSALIGALVGGLGVKWLDIRSRRRDRSWDQRQDDLRIVQEATEAADAAVGASLGDKPANTAEEAQNLVLAALLRGSNATDRIGDNSLTSLFYAYAVGINMTVNGDHSQELVDNWSPSTNCFMPESGSFTGTVNGNYCVETPLLRLDLA
jgi:hypothetical protein